MEYFGSSSSSGTEGEPRGKLKAMTLLTARCSRKCLSPSTIKWDYWRFGFLRVRLVVCIKSVSLPSQKSIEDVSLHFPLLAKLKVNCGRCLLLCERGRLVVVTVSQVIFSYNKTLNNLS